MRYRGQGHEIAVPVTSLDAASLRAGFDAGYATLFGRTIPRLEVEVLTWTLALATHRPLPAPVPEVATLPGPTPAGHRNVLDPASGLLEEAAVIERRTLHPGMRFDGPALVVEDETTTIVPRGFACQLNALRQLILEDFA
ncbi:hypothetical protein ACFQU2_08720 [Siccirubricoccus deserti]